MSFKQSKLSGFFRPVPNPSTDQKNPGGSRSDTSGSSLPAGSKSKAAAVDDSTVVGKSKAGRTLPKSSSRTPPRHLQVRSDNARRLPAQKSPLLPATSPPELPPPASSAPQSSAPTCKFPSELESSQLRTPKRMTQDSASRFSSPLVRRSSTPVVVDPKQSFDLGYAPPSSPTRTLFARRAGDSSASKRTADLALLSPKKDRLKSARTSPALVELPTLPESVPSLPSYLSSPSLPCSPLSPLVKRAAFDRDMEIKGSDDEGDFSSDCSLPDLEMLLSRKPRQDVPPPAAAVKATGSKTKLRNPVLGGRLPVTSTAKPMFDMKTLMEHQRRDEAIAASSTRLNDDDDNDNDADFENEGSDARSGEDGAPPSPNTTRRKFISVAGVNDEDVAGKAMRAMERTEAVTSTKDYWYFFKTGKLPPAEQQPFPKVAASGPWAMLAKEGTRRKHFQSNTLQCVARRHRLPDEIFTWVLMAIEGEKRSIQLVYSSLLSANTNQIRELVTPGCLRELFRHIDAADDVDDEELQLVQQDRKAYVGRNWSGLRTYLKWLQTIAGSLDIESIKYAVVALLRMAADRALMSNTETRIVHQEALTNLVEAVYEAVWDDFCQHACSSVWTAFGSSSLRLASIQQIASIAYKSRDLRRRLALAFFLGDPALARQHPDEQVFIPEAMHHLKGDEFRIKRKTNYVELRAQIQLFDIALDDGSFSPGDSSSDPDEAFNAEVDHLAQQLRTIWGSINDSGAAYLSRTEAKSSIDCAQKRLTYAVRTRPPPKRSIFEPPEKRGEVVTEMQKDFMNKFIGALKKPRPDVLEGNERYRSLLSSDDTSEAEDSYMTA